HTSFSRDWSSDVCSSDLLQCLAGTKSANRKLHGYLPQRLQCGGARRKHDVSHVSAGGIPYLPRFCFGTVNNKTTGSSILPGCLRSEERRVGKERGVEGRV